MQSQPVFTPQQIMERQIRLIDHILDQATQATARASAQSSGEGAK